VSCFASSPVVLRVMNAGPIEAAAIALASRSWVR
jgi:hypothetical protein